MSGEITFVDETGAPSVQDIQEAMDAVKFALMTDILTLPPSLAVQMANIHRCLKFALGVRTVVDKSK